MARLMEKRFVDENSNQSDGEGSTSSDDDGALSSARSTLSRSTNFLEEFEKSNHWQWFMNCVIMANTCALSKEADDPKWRFAELVDNLFLSIFCVELSFRLFVYGCKFFTNDDRGWNWFDCIVVCLGVIDQWVFGLVFTDGRDGDMQSAVAALRVIRLLRVLRALKLFKQFKQLRLLANGLIGSVSSVFWIAMMFLALVFVSAIFTTNLIGHVASGPDSPWTPENSKAIQRWFGTMLRSMETLSVFLTCDDWSTPVRMVIEVYPAMELFFVWYMVVGAMLILSLLTGLMADKMKEARVEDEEAELTQPNDFRDDLGKIRKQMEALYQVEVLELNEERFEDLVSIPLVNKALADAGLKDMDDNQRTLLFKAFDSNGNGTVDFSEISNALHQLSKHQACSSLEIMKVEGVLVLLDRRLRDWHDHHRVDRASSKTKDRWDHRLESVHARSALLKARVRTVYADLQEFFKAKNFDPPSTSVLC